ncbi:MAG: hypothetical protein WCG55_00610 [bacterium]
MSMKKMSKTILRALFVGVFLLAGTSVFAGTVFAKGGHKVKDTQTSVPDYGALYEQKTKDANLSHDMITGTIAAIEAHTLSVSLTEVSGKLPVGTLVTVATAHAKMTRTGSANLSAKPSRSALRSMSAKSQTNAPKVSMSDFAVGDAVTVVGSLDTNNAMKAKQILAHAKNDFHISQPVK